ncbi:gamma-aminobutyric acid type B receptor subunit 2 [Misgurnus anguillicaudatus]|uniref:gamma-aminobutyric acid type B receptor subunit 2 n=1 Tax=Misgurnus anguillicaudatus TaxID=75329 RepID=UPI003CCFC259
MEYWWKLLNFITFWALTQEPSCYCLVRHQLPVLWIMPVNGEPGKDNITAEVLPAVQLALQHLSEQPPPLGNYELQLHLTDSECNNAKALKAFFDATFYGPKPLMIFGGVCPSVTSLIAQSLEAWNLAQLSFAVTAPSLANKRRFPNFFHVVPSDSAVNLALVRFLRHYGWNRVGTLTQNEQKFTEVQRDLSRHLLEVADIQLVAAESFSVDPCKSIQQLKESDVRIVITHFDVSMAAEVLCCVYNFSMYGQKYQWILPDWTQGNWWTITSLKNCTDTNIQTALEGSISADFETLSSSHIRGISGRTPQEYEMDYNKQQLKRLGASKFHGFAYDGTWVIAKVLTRVMETVRYRERYSIYRNFTVTDQEMSQMILEAIDKINFFGVTGQVMFQRGERVANVQFAQFQDGKAVKIGKYKAITGELEFISPVQFHGAGPTKDRTYVYHQRKHISIFLYSIITSISILGVLTACCLLFFNVKNRNHWSLSMSSPVLTTVIIIGSVFSYFCIFFLGLDGSYISDGAFEASCSVQLWLLSIGYTAAFGTMFAKTLRIHAIFKNNRIEKRITKDYGLTLLVMFFLLDMSLLICMQILDPLRRTVKEYHIQPDPHEQDFSIQPFSEHCENAYMGFWMAAFYGYKGILLLSICFLAWTTRHAKVPAVSDSRGIRISAFMSGPVILIGICASMLFQDQPNVKFCIVALVIITCCSSTLCLVFVPKIIIIRMGPASLSRRFHLTQWRSEIEQDNEPHCKEKEAMKNSGTVDCIPDIKQNISSTIDILLSDNLQFQQHMNKLDSELEYLTRRLNVLSPHHLEDLIIRSSVHNAGKNKCLTVSERSNCNRNGLEDINSPEHIQRRLSLQLPILHHAYLPYIGGVNSSPLDSSFDI